MPLDSTIVGQRIGAVTVVCDARWLMAYAAGIPDERPELFDTTAAFVVHPLFPVAPEWELLVTHRLTPSSMHSHEVMRGVHAAHDIIIERAIRPGESIDISATVIAVGQRPAGATQNVLFEATDGDGAGVWRTNLMSLFRGVELIGTPTSIEVNWPRAPAPANTPDVVVAERSSWVRPIDAHVYTECARIWNPIHTDVAIAHMAGLNAPILHGTATLARAVSIITELAGAPLGKVDRVSGAFTAMIALGSTLRVRLLEVSGSALHFDVFNEAGERAIRDGLVTIR